MQAVRYQKLPAAFSGPARGILHVTHVVKAASEHQAQMVEPTLEAEF